MANNKRNFLTTKTALVAASVGIICVVMVRVMVRHRSRILETLRYALDLGNPLRRKKIKVVETADECRFVVSTLKRHCSTNKVLGFDCEWVTVGGTRRPIALLQLSSQQGLCALFRLCSLRQIPKSLRELLEDDEVIKVGVGPQDDAQKLAHDFGVGVASTFDLRFLAALTGHKPEGLAKLSKKILNVQLDKNWRLVCSDWEAKELSDKQLHYAANDALVAVEIFHKLAKELEPKNFWQICSYDYDSVRTRLDPFFEVRFKDDFTANNHKLSANVGNVDKKLQRDWATRKAQSRGICTRSKIQYDNCLLEAPDGELLCTIDRKKAQWYLDQNLGHGVKQEPFTVRLNFEPAGRAVGEVGLYYQTPKENQCVVCGWRDAYIRKNIVPREYRKHFPVVMKSHTSHDVLLLCPHCHQLSNISDLKIRTKLSLMCDAPLANEERAKKCFDVPELKLQLKSAARALLFNEAKIPADRKTHLRKIVLSHYPNANELSSDILEEAANIETTLDNEHYCQHGEKVVQKFKSELGGLIKLEKLWREHFLHTMKPKFLPTLWNVNHNANRLEIRAHEGRIEKDDLITAGLDASTVTEVNLQNNDDTKEDYSNSFII